MVAWTSSTFGWLFGNHGHLYGYLEILHVSMSHGARVQVPVSKHVESGCRDTGSEPRSKWSEPTRACGTVATERHHNALSTSAIPHGAMGPDFDPHAVPEKEIEKKSKNKWKNTFEKKPGKTCFIFQIFLTGKSSSSDFHWDYIERMNQSGAARGHGTRDHERI